MDTLIVDLERNVKLLGTPERAQVGQRAVLGAGACERWVGLARCVVLHVHAGCLHLGPPVHALHSPLLPRPQVLLAAMQSVLLGDSRCANVLIPRVCNAVLAAPSSTRHVGLGLPPLLCWVLQLCFSVLDAAAALLAAQHKGFKAES